MNNLDQLRRELEQLANMMRGRHYSTDDGPHAAELEYHLAQLADALGAFHPLAFRSMHRHDPRPELLAHLDTLLKRTAEIRELAERAREVLLRPPVDEEKPGFSE